MQKISSAAFLDTKPHYDLLDGLRGVAALLVMFYHVFEAYATSPVDQRFNHGYLAVDFFFILSGFVVGYAYDDRWNGRLTTREFFKRRIIRLHPMVIVGVLLGAVAYCVQGCERWDGTHVAFGAVAAAVLLNLFMLPVLPGAAADVRGHNETYPLNGPNWSLFFEYIGNILYALAIRRMSTRWLAWLVGLTGAGLAMFAVGNFSGAGHLGVGWSFTEYNLPGGLLRMLFSFSAGLLMARLFSPIKKLRGAFWICSAGLAVLLCIPHVGGMEKLWLNGLYDSVCCLFLFPLLVWIGASGKATDGVTKRICKFMGDISYPVYVVHYPFMYLYYSWVWKEGLPFSRTWPVALAIIIGSVLLAFAFLKLYDEPVRRMLSRKFLKKKAASQS